MYFYECKHGDVVSCLLLHYSRALTIETICCSWAGRDVKDVSNLCLYKVSLQLSNKSYKWSAVYENSYIHTEEKNDNDRLAANTVTVQMWDKIKVVHNNQAMLLWDWASLPSPLKNCSCILIPSCWYADLKTLLSVLLLYICCTMTDAHTAAKNDKLIAGGKTAPKRYQNLQNHWKAFLFFCLIGHVTMCSLLV